MSDLLSKLEEQSEWHNDGHGPLHKEAADEIKRLRAALLRAREWVKAYEVESPEESQEARDLVAEIDALTDGTHGQ